MSLVAEAYLSLKHFTRSKTSHTPLPQNTHASATASLQLLLQSLAQRNCLEENIEWFSMFSNWLRQTDALPDFVLQELMFSAAEKASGMGQQLKTPTEDSRCTGDLSYARLRFFLEVLHDFPAAKEEFLNAVCDVLRNSDALSLFAIDGINPQKFGARICKNLLENYTQQDQEKNHRLVEVLNSLFFKPKDVSWLLEMPADLIVSLTTLMYVAGDVSQNPWRQLRFELIECSGILASRVLSAAFSGLMSSDENLRKFRKSRYLALARVNDEFHALLRMGERAPFAIVYEKSLEVLSAIHECETQLHSHLQCSTHSAVVTSQLKAEWHLVLQLLARLKHVVLILSPLNGVLPLRNVVQLIALIVKDVQEQSRFFIKAPKAPLQQLPCPP